MARMRPLAHLSSLAAWSWRSAVAIGCWATSENRGMTMAGDAHNSKRLWEIVEKLRAAGYEAYLAGGCVRDLLLGREPKDFDVATSATPDVVLEMFASGHLPWARILGWFWWPLRCRGGGQKARSRVCRDGGGDVPVGWGVFRWAASGCGAVYEERRGRCAAAGFHDQRAAAGSVAMSAARPSELFARPAGRHATASRGGDRLCWRGCGSGGGSRAGDWAGGAAI